MPLKNEKEVNGLGESKGIKKEDRYS